MKVEELMTPIVETCRPDTTLTDAAMRMWHHDCGVLPVIDRSDRVVGIITDRDISIGLALRHRSPDEVSVADVMATDLYTCTSDDDVHRAMETMAEAKVRRLPVIDGHQLVGIVAVADVARALPDRPVGDLIDAISE